MERIYYFNTAGRLLYDRYTIMKLAGRHAIITGAGQGLGASIAEHYVIEGASVLLCARTEADLVAVQEKLLPRLIDGQQLMIRTTDVADPVQVDGLVDYGLRTFPRIDILVNNAGVHGPYGPIDEVDWGEWVRAIQINLLGTVYASRAILPQLKKQRYGKIINLSGGGATSPLPGISAYAASKAAVVRFVETLALEVKEFGIDVNAVAPGALATRLTDQVIEAGPEKVGTEFHTRMMKVKQTGETSADVGAALCVYLGSAESDGISGKLIAAVWDPWHELQRHRADIDGTDIYTLRRIVPKDRGLPWGNG